MKGYVVALTCLGEMVHHHSRSCQENPVFKSKKLGNSPSIRAAHLMLYSNTVIIVQEIPRTSEQFDVDTVTLLFFTSS